MPSFRLDAPDRWQTGSHGAIIYNVAVALHSVPRSLMAEKKKAQVVRLEGDWDISRRDELERLIEPAYVWPGEVILDLHDVAYADSTILAALVVLRNRRRTKGLPLPSLVVGTQQIKRLLNISGLSEAFPTFASIEEAEAAD